MNNIQLPQEEYYFNEVSGKLVEFGKYRIIDVQPPKIYSIGCSDATLRKFIDKYGRVVETETEVRRLIDSASHLTYFMNNLMLCYIII